MRLPASWQVWLQILRHLLSVLVLGVVMCCLLVTLLAWHGPSRYVCEWSLILPAADTEASVHLANVGQAQAGARSFLDGRVLDHRVNYRQVLLGPAVRRTVAAMLETEPRLVPRPRVRLLDQSSIFTVEIRSDSAEEAFVSSVALLQAFQERIQQLRSNETEIRRAAVEQEVVRAEQALAASASRLSQFRRRSGLVSEDQVETTVRRLDLVESRLLERRALLAGLRTSAEIQLKPLGLTIDQVATALSLAHDGVFLELATRRRLAEADLRTQGSGLGSRHPRRQELQARADRALVELIEVASSRLGRDVTEEEVADLFSLLDHDSGGESAGRLAELMAKAKATTQEIGEWQRGRTELKALLDSQVKALAELEVLTNLTSLDQAMLGSSKAQADVAGQKPFASYPLAQVLEEPTLPQAAVEVHPLLSVLAAVLASACWCIGVLLWAVGRAGAIDSTALGTEGEA